MAETYQYLRYQTEILPGKTLIVDNICISDSETLDVICDDGVIDVLLDAKTIDSEGNRYTGTVAGSVINTGQTSTMVTASSGGVFKRYKLLILNPSTSSTASCSVAYSCSNVGGGQE